MVNQQQILAFLRWAISTGGAYAVGKGWLNADQLTSIGNALPGFIAAVATVAPIIYSIFFVHTETATVAAAAAMPNVASVTTLATTAGSALANKIPSPVVQVVGTQAAVSNATKVNPDK